MTTSVAAANHPAVVQDYETAIRNTLELELGHTLPVIIADETAKVGRITRYSFVNQANEKLGVASLLVDNYHGKEHFANVRLCVSHRQGYGSAIYAWAIGAALARGHDFVNDPNGNRNASLNTWRRLVRTGLAEQTGKTPSGAEQRDISPRYLGDFIVRASLADTLLYR